MAADTIPSARVERILVFAGRALAVTGALLGAVPCYIVFHVFDNGDKVFDDPIWVKIALCLLQIVPLPIAWWVRRKGGPHHGRTRRSGCGNGPRGGVRGPRRMECLSSPCCVRPRGYCAAGISAALSCGNCAARVVNRSLDLVAVKAFAKLKSLPRKIAARTVATLWDALGGSSSGSPPLRNAPTISPTPDMFHSNGIRSNNRQSYSTSRGQ
jgi:hypothetical protein